MIDTYWHKQSADEPLYPDILWSRPESKNGAGKLAIIGGNAFAFGAPGLAYSIALESGAGVCNVLLPQAIKKTVKLMLPDAQYAPSNPSGSFSKQALDEFLQISSWSDSVILSGDLGRNSETAVLLEKYVQVYPGQLTLTQDTADYFKAFPKLILKRANSLLVVSLAQLQKICVHAPLMIAITYGMTLVQFVESLHEITELFPLVTIVSKHHDTIVVARNGEIVSYKNEDEIWRVKTAAKASVFWMQNPNKPLESITSSLIDK